MKIAKTKLLERSTYFFLSILIVVLSLMLQVNHSSAATVKFLTNPSSTEQTQGSNITIIITAEAPAGTVYVVQACVVYDSSKLKLTNTNYSANPLKSATGSAPSTDCPAGQLQLGRYDITPVADASFTVAQLTFQVLAANTSTVLSFNDSKSYIGSDTPTGSQSATMTLKPVPAAPATSNPSTPPSTNNTSNTNNNSNQAVAIANTPQANAQTAAITDSNSASSSNQQATSPDVSIAPEVYAQDTVAATSQALETRSNNMLRNITVGVAGVGLIAVGSLMLKKKFFPNQAMIISQSQQTSTLASPPPLDSGTVINPDKPPQDSEK